MNGSPEELRSWLQRAESFVRGLNYLPGEWGILVATEPPISSEAVDALAAKLSLGLPPPLRTLYVEGGGGLYCSYNWGPHGEMLERMREIFPYQHSVYGGPRFIGWDEMMASGGTYGHAEGCEPSTEAQEKGLEIWKQTIPFIDVGNGDAVGLHMTGESDVYPVVYLCHDDQECPVTPISPSFEQFLSDWEKVCYVGPEIWLLDSFLADGKGLSVEGTKALQWRELMMPR